MTDFEEKYLRKNIEKEIRIRSKEMRKTLEEVSLEIGKSKTYLTAMFSKNKSFNLQVLISLSSALDYDFLTLVSPHKN
jgi:AraC-like DNA-binding protein